METVLVVEDEYLIRHYLLDSLMDEGYHVVEAATADAAILILETRLDITLVFTDIDMPGSMDGLKLAACVRDRWPPLHIIIASGHRSPSIVDMPEHSVFFRKPYQMRDIVKAIEAF